MGVVAAPADAQDWRSIEPALAGFRPEIGERLDDAVGRGEFPGLHGVLVVRNGWLVLDRSFAGPDERWGEPLGIVDHHSTLRHDMRSITKSIVSLLYGIALARSLVPPAAARLYDQFPAHGDLAADPARRRISLAHVLSMRMGLEWNEDMTYADPRNGEREMEAAADRYRYILSRPMSGPPGKSWTYCGGATALLGRLIARGSGTRLEDFARSHLFEPLGIYDVEWIAASDGEAAASSGLRLRPRDLARIGQMILNRGHWNGQPVVPRNWLAASFKPRAYVERGLKYGYQWWLGQLVANGKPWYGAFGNGGQRLLIVPSLDMVVAITAGNYNQADQWKMPLRVMSKVVMPSLDQA